MLQVIPGLVTGGAERGCIDVAIALAQAGGKPLVASEGGPMVRELERAGVRHIVLPLASKNPVVIWNNARKLERIIRENRVDIIHARSRAPAWSAWLAGRRCGAAFMTTFHAPYNFGNRWKRLYNSVMAKGERIIAVSGFVRDHIVSSYGVDPARIRMIHRGVDLDQFSPDRVPVTRVLQLMKQWNVPEDRSVIMLPGRLTRWKGQEVLIDAIHRMGRQDIFCLLVGGDQGRTAYRQELMDRIRTLGLGHAVRLVDHCSDMPAAFMLAHVVVSASTGPEAFGRVIAEAQAMGKPVVVTSHGAVRETVVEGQTGWVVPPGDPDALAQALNEALSM
ncbi:MAG: glycosyltransferase family 4 protein, partial [Pseudomonadota bacterium]|nr:glycosyltransferase family 4 protein [Pseudomonadota bacterium]